MPLRETCDSCGGSLQNVFSMGSMPLANNLVSPSHLHRPPETYPLIVAECSRCKLSQLRYTVDPVVLYSNYKFFTGASQPNIKYFNDLADWIREKAPDAKTSLEIGSNDGVLLSAMEKRGFDVTGVDPAKAHCDIARANLTRGVAICDYWPSAAVVDSQQKFDVAVACNVLGHSDDLNAFVRGIKKVLNPGGLLVIEVQDLTSLLKQATFEIIYHEHVSYFDEHSLGWLLASHGFEIQGASILDAQCGALRMWATLSGNPGDARPHFAHNWKTFADDVNERRIALLARIAKAKSEGRRVCFYGAPAKATQLANFWALDSGVIEFATDTTPEKQGMCIPGVNIPVVHPSKLRPTDTAIVAAWNFYPNIVEREAAFIAAGGQLVCPTVEGCAL